MQKFIAIALLLLIPVAVLADGTDVMLNYVAGTGAGENLETDATGSRANGNTFIGVNAGRADTTGNANVALGYQALSRLTSGIGNIGIGYLAGDSLTASSHLLRIQNGFYPAYGIFGTLSSGYFGINKVPTRAWDVTGSAAASDSIIAPYVSATTSFLGVFAGDMVVTGDTLTVSAETIISYDAEADTSTVRITATPNIALYGADGDAYLIGINTSDAAVFTGAGGGYSFDAGLSATTGAFSSTVNGLTALYSIGADSTFTAANIPSGSAIVFAAGASASEITLPTAVAGLIYTFITADADSLILLAGASDGITDSSAAAASNYCATGQIGETVTLLAISDAVWQVVSSTGTWGSY